jgi:hypothetical protein
VTCPEDKIVQQAVEPGLDLGGAIAGFHGVYAATYDRLVQGVEDRRIAEHDTGRELYLHGAPAIPAGEMTQDRAEMLRPKIGASTQLPPIEAAGQLLG